MTSWTPAPAGGQSSLDDSPGQVRGGKLRILDPEDCLSLLESASVGRVGFMSADGIVMLPVNYAVTAKTIVFRTAPDTLLAAQGNGLVSFEVDRIDEISREGWSVLVQGHARKVAGEDEVRRLEHCTSLEPWASGARDVWVRIIPVHISGRRIRRP